MYTPGSSSGDNNNPQEACCDLRHACLQTCGAGKAYCDEQFLKCGKTACDSIPEDDEEARKSCESSASMNQILVQFDTNCQRYELAQQSHCECVPKDQAPAKRERVLRAFYNKFNPEAVDKVAALAAKADTKGKLVALLLKLYQKYPAAIRKVKDPQQEMMEEMMKRAEKEKAEKEDEEDEIESDAEDLGTEEL